MRTTRLLPLASAVVAAFAVVPTAGASAAQRCNHTHGTELAHSRVVKVYKVKVGSSFRYFGCARPSGPVVPLTQTFKGGAVKLVAAKGAYVAFTRTIGTSDTIAVVDARTGRKRHGLYPPYDIEFDVDPSTPQIGAARVNAQGGLAVAYVGLGSGSTTDSTVYVYAFDTQGNQQLLDSAPSSKLRPSSLRMSGDTISWTHSGVRRSAMLGQVSLGVVTGGGALEGDVTTSPEGGIACHVLRAGVVGTCIGSFSPNTAVTVTATGPANATVTISGACSAVHAPVAGQATSVATCVTTMSRARTAKVTFG